MSKTNGDEYDGENKTVRGRRGVQFYVGPKCTEKALLEQSGGSKPFGYLGKEVQGDNRELSI